MIVANELAPHHPSWVDYDGRAEVDRSTVRRHGDDRQPYQRIAAGAETGALEVAKREVVVGIDQHRGRRGARPDRFVGPLAVAPSETYRAGDHRLVFDSLGNKNSYQNNVLESFPTVTRDLAVAVIGYGLEGIERELR